MVQSHVVNNIYRYHPLFSYFSRVILILSAAGIGYGIMRGEQAEVLKKAVAVCLQCIGIG